MFLCQAENRFARNVENYVIPLSMSDDLRVKAGRIKKSEKDF